MKKVDKIFIRTYATFLVPTKSRELCASAPPDPQLARAMTFACHAHGMTSSLTQQTFGGGGGGEGGGAH